MLAQKEAQELKERLDRKRKGIVSLETSMKKNARTNIETAKAAENLIKEATVKLQTALDKGNLENVRVAQMMLQGAQSATKDLSRISEESSKIFEKVTNQKDSLMTAYLKKV